MLNVWIDYPNNSPDSDDDLSICGEFNEGVQTNRRSWEEHFDYPQNSFTDDFDTHSLSRSLSPLPVVSTEAGSCYSSADQENPHMPSARVYYSPSSPSGKEDLTGGSQEASSSAATMVRPQPQIHVQVNLPSNSHPPSRSSAQNRFNYQEQNRSYGNIGGQAQSNQVVMSAPKAVVNLVPQNASLANVQGGAGQPVNQNSHGQTSSVPMLFDDGNNSGMGYGGSNNAGRSQTNGNGSNNSSGDGRNQFYSSFVPESDFLEFHSMYYHLCDFYNTYGHANVPKHPSHFILASWVEELRQRKHIYDLQERGVDVANTAPPLSRRQTRLLEDLGFRWHISASENSSILEHMKLVDRNGNGADYGNQSESVQAMSVTSGNVNTNNQQQLLQQQSGWVNQNESFQVNSNNFSSSNVGSQVNASHSTMQNVSALNGFSMAGGGGLPPGSLAIGIGGTENTTQVPFNSQNLAALSQQQSRQQFGIDHGMYANQQIGFTHQRVRDSTRKDKPRMEEEEEEEEPRDPNLDSAEYAWKMQFKKLAEYKRKNGHCSVPARYNEDPKLGHWVMTQRRQFNLMKRGKSSSMNPERIKMLNELGFSWSIRIDPEKMWNLRFEQLKEYKKMYGDCLVPQRFADNPKLGTWYVVNILLINL